VNHKKQPKIKEILNLSMLRLCMQLVISQKVDIRIKIVYFGVKLYFFHLFTLMYG
jgi:hypothetical protein